MSAYYCLLGNTPDLSLLELRLLIGSKAVEQVSSMVARVELGEDQTPQQLMDILGGTVKICQPLKSLEDADPAEIEEEITNYLSSLDQSKIIFGLAELGRDHLPPLSLPRIKRALTKEQLHCRFIESPRSGLSASVLIHQPEVIEVMVLMIDSSWWLCRTVAVQNIDQWAKRDRQKPYADRRKGMLPPKVARMMVNIALSEVVTSARPLLYDPFCGTGTILMEALVRQVEVTGSDLDKVAAAGTLKNLTWLAEQENLQGVQKIFEANVTQVQPQQLLRPVDCIVTEPFLGKVTPQASQLPGIFKGLDKLYLGAFKHWRRILSDQGVVVIVFPLVETQTQTFSLQSLIDKLAPLGYTIVSEPVLYRRPQAIIQRQIHVFRYQAQT